MSAPTPTASTGRGPRRTEKVAIPKRRSPSMSGTSLSTAMAKEKGTVTAISAHTPALTGVPAKWSQTPRLTTSERTNVIDPAASAG